MSVKLRLFAALPEIIRKGKLIRSEENKHKDTHPNINKYHWVRGSVKIDGVTTIVDINVEEHSSGKLFYNLTLPGSEYFQENTKIGDPDYNPSIPGETTASDRLVAAGEHPTEGIGNNPNKNSLSGKNDLVNIKVSNQTPTINRGSFNPETLTIALLTKVFLKEERLRLAA